MVDKDYATREIHSLLDGVTNNLGFFGSPKREKIEALIGQIRETLGADPKALAPARSSEDDNPDEFARTVWVIEDLRGAIANRYGMSEAGVDIPRDELLEIGGRMQRQLEGDCVERGWDSINTLLSMFEDEFPYLQRLCRLRDAEDEKIESK